jgi:hypothetical protein
MTYFICCTLTKAACVFIVKVIKERRNPTIVLVFQAMRFEKVRGNEQQFEDIMIIGYIRFTEF